VGFAIIAFYLLTAVTRAVAAARLDLFGDESFYYLCSRHLALAYADHPFMTALWVRAGTEIAGPNPLGVRLLFLLSGLLFPFAMQRLARPIVGSDDAWLVFGASLVVPVFAYHGVIAIPDVPLLLFTALALHGFERSLATDRRGWWTFTGIAVALGLATHLRFALVPAAFGLYAAIDARARRVWRSPGAWQAGFVGLLGALPVLVHNLEVGFAPLRYQLIERHAGGLHPGALSGFFADQLLAAGPAMFVALVGTLWFGLRRLGRSDAATSLLLVFAATHLLVFLAAAPLADARHVSLHWPAPGYVALLVLLPGALRRFLSARPTALRRVLVALVPGCGALMLAGAGVELATGFIGIPAIHRPFAAYGQVIAATRGRIESGSGPSVPLLIADGYKLGGNLALAFGRRTDVYVLRHRDDVRHGRDTQLDLWGLGEPGLRARAGEEALLVLEREGPKGWRAHARSFLTGRRRVGRLELSDGEDSRVFLFYRGRVAGDGGLVDAPASDRS